MGRKTRLDDQASLSDENSAMLPEEDSSMETSGAVFREGDGEYLQRASDSWQDSKDWFDKTLRSKLEDNYRRFNNQHPASSKYHTLAYQKKSKHFRPRTRAGIRKLEAACAVAFFSTAEMVNISPLDEGSEEQRISADMTNALINYRLENTIPWYKILIAGCQDAMNAGVVISKQTWEYDYQTRYFEEVSEDGETKIVTEQEVRVDRPRVDLRPVENIRLSPQCDWLDPINSSPYIIDLVPMYVVDVRKKMRRGEFRKIPESLLTAAVEEDWDSVRLARLGESIDKYADHAATHDYRTVWVYECIMRNEDGEDEVFHTINHQILLSDPKPLREYYLHGIRPYSLGCSIVESHKTYPAGVNELSSPTQDEINDLANLRQDNIRLALNKRYFVQRGAAVDMKRLVRGVAGGVVLMSDPSRNVKESDTRDVTSSSYQEHDRLALEMDDLNGTFSQSTVGSSRNLGETVGVTSLLSDNANQIQAFIVKTIAETWIESVMGQLAQLEQTYETDETAIMVSAAKANRSASIAMGALGAPVKVKVRMGADATNPVMRINKLAVGLDTVAKYMPHLMGKLDEQEIVKEIMGALGYSDGERFLPSLFEQNVNPEVQKLQEENQQLRQQIEMDVAKEQRYIQVAQINAQGRQAIERMKAEVQVMLHENKGNREAQLVAMRRRLDEVDRLIRAEAEDTKRQELFLQREALSHQIQEADRRYQLDLRDRGNGQPMGGVPEGSRAMDLPGNDKAGVIARGNYGDVPENVE